MSYNNKKSKKKSKSAILPKPIKVKKQDDPIIYPMEHYLDNKVELIPELLKKNKLEDILDQCLNEILCISKKRLLSVIDSIETETSDDDMCSADENNSQEEISSNSNVTEQKGVGSKTCKSFDAKTITNTCEDENTPSKESNCRAENENEDDFNDDVISLEGGDLLNEMKEHMEEYGGEVVESTPAKPVTCPEDPSDKKPAELCQSSRVNKVSPISRRGDRVRNKTKESKRAKKLEEKASIEAEPSKPQKEKLPSKHEDGSVQQ